MFRRTMLASIAVAALAGFPAMAQNTDPIKIGVIYPIHTVNGEKGVEGAQLAATMVNENGGVLDGRPIEIIAYDTNYSPVEGVAAVQRLLDQDGVKIIMGELVSTVALAVIPLVQAQNAFFVTTVAKHPEITTAENTNVVRLNSTTAMDSEFYNAELQRRVGTGKVAVMAENSDFGRLTVENLQALFGDQLVYSDYFGAQQSDFNSMVTNARASNPDVVCIATSAAEQSANILRAMQDLGLRPEQTCLMPGLLSSDVVTLAGDAAEGVYAAEIYVSTINNDLNHRFVERFQAEHGRVPEKMEELSFEGMWLLAEAINAAGTADDIAELAATIRGGTWQTPRGEISFNEIGQAVGPELVAIEVKDGALIESVGN